MSKRLAEKAQKEAAIEKMEEDGEQEEPATPAVCDPSVTEVQTSPIPSSNYNTACMYHSILIHSSHTMHKVPLLALLIPL